MLFLLSNVLTKFKYILENFYVVIFIRSQFKPPFLVILFNFTKIIEVIWNPPILHWIKCNTDGSANLNTSSCEGIFRDKNSKFVLCFAENTGVGNAYHAELSGAMRAIELAAQHNWSSLWLECDYELVVNAFKNQSLVPWSLRNRWKNYLLITSNMNFLVTHIYLQRRELLCRCLSKLWSYCC